MKERITITIDKGMLKVLDKNISERVFGGRSHALEFLIKKRMDSERKK